jgi:hypothetical protein
MTTVLSGKKYCSVDKAHLLAGRRVGPPVRVGNFFEEALDRADRKAAHVGDGRRPYLSA